MTTDHVPSIPGQTPRYAQTPTGDQLVYFFSFVTSWTQLPATVVYLVRGHVFQGIETLYLGWCFLILVWPVLTALILRVEMKRAFRMSGLLIASFVPFVLFLPVVMLANLAYAFFWIDFPFVRSLVWVHLVLALWPPLVYARYAALTGRNRWAGPCLAVVTFFVTLFLAVYSWIGLCIGERALSWV